jgi:riboflavin synthase
VFTGLVAETGRVQVHDAAELVVRCSPAFRRPLAAGASVSVSGVCLTVARLDGEDLAFDLSPETLGRTTLGALRAGADVNLEAPLRAGDPLGGHWVQGHVDGTTQVLSVARSGVRGDHRDARFELPVGWLALVAPQGSVAIDGVSLTVAGIDDGAFRVALVPHTLAVTTLGGLRPGDRVNVELDVLAKYVERRLAAASGR